MKKAKAQLKKDTTYSTSEMKHYLGVLNEMHGENLKGIRESSVITNKKIDDMAEILGKHIKILNSHTEMIGVLMEDVSVLKTDVLTLKLDMVIVKEDLSTIKSDLKRKVDYDEFSSLVKRVQRLESKV